ncbi:hypothetical protein ACGF0J_07985 [Nonomuraea sp. NPDC047897]
MINVSLRSTTSAGIREAIRNGAAESLNSTLKVEFVYRHHFRVPGRRLD